MLRSCTPPSYSLPIQSRFLFTLRALVFRTTVRFHVALSKEVVYMVAWPVLSEDERDDP